MKDTMKYWSTLAAALLLAAAAPVSAQQTSPDEPIPGDDNGYRLSIADALRRSLANNLDLVSARNDPAISEQNLIQEGAGYDVAFSFNPEHQESQQEISNLFSLNEFTSDSGTFSFGKSMMWGGDYSVDLNLERSEAVGPLVTTPTSYDARLSLSMSVPIIGTSRGGAMRGRSANTERLILAQGNLEISGYTLSVEAQRVVQETESAYWNVVAARAALRTRKLALARAEDLLELNRKKVEVGTLAPIEITQAEAGVASNEEQVIIAEADLENAEDEVRRLMNVPDNDPMWALRVVPTDRPDLSRRQIELEAAIDQALSSRPEILSARQRLENDQLSESNSRRRMRPGLAANASLRPAGNNFETVFDDMGDPVDQTTKGTFDEALSEIPDFDNYSWSVGLVFDYTIGNRAAKSSYQVASLNRRKSEVAVQNQEQAIRIEVRQSTRSVESGAKRIEAARKNVELQEKKLDAEQKKFENGMSTSFEVLTFQNDLADAELALIRAGLDYTRALTALERSQGTLLVARGLSLADAEPGVDGTE